MAGFHKQAEVSNFNAQKHNMLHYVDFRHVEKYIFHFKGRLFDA